MKIRNLTGKKFGILTVIRVNGKNKKSSGGNLRWDCLCECGGRKNIAMSSLISGRVTSCGCLRRINSKKLAHQNRRIYPFGEAAILALFRKYSTRATKKRLVFSLSIDDFKHLIRLPCIYCGIPPNQIRQPTTSNGFVKYNGIDRKDNIEGYTINNSVPCCGFCNRAKNKYNITEFEKWINNLVIFRASNARA